MNHVVISIGSNINPRENVEKALQLIELEVGLKATSRLLRTKPIGYSEQPEFLNCGIVVHTPLSFADLKYLLKSIEKRLGRIPAANKYGPRTIDLDIIMWNNEIRGTDIYDRDFLQQIVLELLPDFKLPKR